MTEKEIKPSNQQKANLKFEFDWVVYGHAPSVHSEGEFQIIDASQPKQALPGELKHFISTLPHQTFNRIHTSEIVNFGFNVLTLENGTMLPVISVSLPTEETHGRLGAYFHAGFYTRSLETLPSQHDLIRLLGLSNGELLKEASRLKEIYVGKAVTERQAGSFLVELKQDETPSELETPLVEFFLGQLLNYDIGLANPLLIKVDTDGFMISLQAATYFLYQTGINLQLSFMSQVDAKDLARIRPVGIVGVSKNGSFGNSEQFNLFRDTYHDAKFIETKRTNDSLAITASSKDLPEFIPPIYTLLRRWNTLPPTLAQALRTYISSFENVDQQIQYLNGLVNRIDTLESLVRTIEDGETLQIGQIQNIPFLSFVLNEQQATLGLNKLLWDYGCNHPDAFHPDLPILDLVTLPHFAKLYKTAWDSRQMSDIRKLYKFHRVTVGNPKDPAHNASFSGYFKTVFEIMIDVQFKSDEGPEFIKLFSELLDPYYPFSACAEKLIAFVAKEPQNKNESLLYINICTELIAKSTLNSLASKSQPILNWWRKAPNEFTRSLTTRYKELNIPAERLFSVVRDSNQLDTENWVIFLLKQGLLHPAYHLEALQRIVPQSAVDTVLVDVATLMKQGEPITRPLHDRIDYFIHVIWDDSKHQLVERFWREVFDNLDIMDLYLKRWTRFETLDQLVEQNKRHLDFLPQFSNKLNSYRLAHKLFKSHYDKHGELPPI